MSVSIPLKTGLPDKPTPPETRPESGGAVGGNPTSNLATNHPGGNR